jgi:uncharacterized protein (UPF0335 family)
MARTEGIKKLSNGETEILTKEYDIYIRKSGKGFDVDIFRKEDKDSFYNEHTRNMKEALQAIQFATK